MPDGKDDVTLALKEDADIQLFGIVGDEDKVFVQLMEEMKKDIPRFEIKVIEGCDHWLIVENPDELDKALENFLDIVKITI
jgi:pimeloyl-ACP methyl ester carboxylesterase